MRGVGLLALVLLIAGCQSKGAAAEERYRIVERNGATSDDLCREARAVARAYLDDRNEQQYQRWSMAERSKCIQADLDRL